MPPKIGGEPQILQKGTAGDREKNSPKVECEHLRHLAQHKQINSPCLPEGRRLLPLGQIVCATVRSCAGSDS